MANWREVIVSGSDAVLGSVTVPSPGIISGILSGNGASVTGVVSASYSLTSSYALNSTAPTFYLGAANNTVVSFVTNTDFMKFTTASNHGFSFSVTKATTSASISLTTPQDLQTTAAPTFAGMTITGDLSVLGTTSLFEVANLLIEDRFILLNSGSANGDAGIVVQSGSAGTFSGVAFGWDDSAGRWGVQQTTVLAQNATALVPEAYVGMVVDIDGGFSDLSAYQRNGNIRISGSRAYIWF